MLSLLLCSLIIVGMSSCTKPTEKTESDSLQTSSEDTFQPEYIDLPYYLNQLPEQTVSDIKKAVSAQGRYHQLALNEELKDSILSLKLPESVACEEYTAIGADAKNQRYIFSINNTPVGGMYF